MLYDSLLTISTVADYLQMSQGFVESEIHLDNREAVYVGYGWRIEPSAVVEYIEARKVLSPLLSRRRTRVVE
jgi:excisionase family DNA binding protein